MLGFPLEVLEDLHCADNFVVVVEIVLDYLIGVVEILGVSVFVGDGLEFLLHIQDFPVLGIRSGRMVRNSPYGVPQTIYIIQGFRLLVTGSLCGKKKGVIGFLESFLADKQFCALEVFVALVINLIRIVLCRGR